jgi:hypothetical protein
MNQITDRNEVIALLRRYEFEFVESSPNLQGNIEPLTAKDISDILYDMNYGAKVFEDDGMVIVKYPVGVCRLESRNEIKNFKGDA